MPDVIPKLEGTVALTRAAARELLLPRCQRSRQRGTTEHRKAADRPRGPDQPRRRRPVPTGQDFGNGQDRRARPAGRADRRHHPVGHQRHHGDHGSGVRGSPGAGICSATAPRRASMSRRRGSPSAWPARGRASAPGLASAARRR